MRPTHRKSLSEAVTTLGLKIRDFIPIEGTDKNSASQLVDTYTLKYRDSGLSITFKQSVVNINKYVVSYTNYNKQRTEYKEKDYSTMEAVVNKFKAWINTNVKPYIEDSTTEDPFAQKDEPFTFFTEEEDNKSDSEKFTDIDIKIFEERLNQLQDFIESRFALQEHQVKQLHDTIKLLTEATKTETKGIWKGLFNTGIKAIAKIIFAEALKEGVKFFLDFFSDPKNFDKMNPSDLIA